MDGAWWRGQPGHRRDRPPLRVGRHRLPAEPVLPRSMGSRPAPRGAVGALAAELLAEALAGYQPVRFTLNLLRPVPMRELSVETRTVRTGARLGLAEAEVRADGRLVSTASLLGLSPLDLGADPASHPPARPADTWAEAEDRWHLDPETEAFIGGALLFRFLVPEDPEDGGVAWLRLLRPVFIDRPPSPLAKVAAAADVPSAVAAYGGSHMEGVGFINADVSCHLSRVPEGDWVRMTTVSRWEPNGIGTVSAPLWNQVGILGRIGQGLVLARGLTPA